MEVMPAYYDALCRHLPGRILANHKNPGQIPANHKSPGWIPVNHKNPGRIPANHKNPGRIPANHKKSWTDSSKPQKILDGFQQTTKILSQESISEPGTSPLQSKNVTHLTMISSFHAQLKTFYIC
jgi:hypothetical protein